MADWLTASQAAIVLTQNSGHVISRYYVCLLGNAGKLKMWRISPRVRLYHRKSVEAYRVRRRGSPA